MIRDTNQSARESESQYPVQGSGGNNFEFQKIQQLQANQAKVGSNSEAQQSNQSSPEVQENNEPEDDVISVDKGDRGQWSDKINQEMQKETSNNYTEPSL